MTRAVTAAVGLLLAVLVVLVAPAGAGAVVIDEVAEALRSDTVFVDPNAERALDPDDVDEVRAAVGNAGTPIYVAVLPAAVADAAGGDPTEVARQLAAAVGRDGTYAVVVGESFRAGSSRIEGAGALADEAFREGGDDTAAVLVDFVRLVRDEAAAGQSTGDDGGDSGTTWLLPVLLAGAVGVAGLLIWRSIRRRRAEAAERAREAEADRQLLLAELAVLADDVVRVEPQVLLHPEAQSDFDAAVNRYRAAEAALEHADEPVDLVRVERVVAEARYAMDRAKAIVDGRQPPDPPSALRQVGHHGEPAVTLDSDHQPTYVGYPGSFQGGWFGGTGGGLFSGLLLGSMLGWGFGGWGYGGTTIINNEGGDSGAGDWGGGDWGGGGDFGGGDFGGGDFGGGDFGG